MCFDDRTGRRRYTMTSAPPCLAIHVPPKLCSSSIIVSHGPRMVSLGFGESDGGLEQDAAQREEASIGEG